MVDFDLKNKEDVSILAELTVVSARPMEKKDVSLCCYGQGNGHLETLLDKT